ncbi:MAG: type II secretion system protein M, partial [Polyangiaceae bacterium]|nr:type II secretion system protein M [Polyangiaceae bacterium]
DPIRAAYDGLNERERRLVALLGGVLGAIVVLLPLYLVLDSISEMETENQELASVLNDLSDQAGELERKRLEREQALARYARPAPPLGSFVESTAQVEGLQLREVTDQPSVSIGEFSRRQVRASLAGVKLRPVIKMLAAIERSDYPVTTQRIQVDHPSDGDSYTFQIGINAYDRSAPESEAGTAGRARTKVGSAP